MYNKQPDTAAKILTGLKKRQYIVEDECGYVKLDPRSQPDQKTIYSFWILLKYIDKIKSKFSISMGRETKLLCTFISRRNGSTKSKCRGNFKPL